MGLIMGVSNLRELFDGRYYRELKGGILEAFGILYSTDLKLYVYPYQPNPKEEIQTSKSLNIHPRFRPLFEFLVNNRRIKDIEDYDPDILQIFSRDILNRIRNGEEGWEVALPELVGPMIKEKNLFGYQKQQEEVSQ
jgi:hypothetical protein